ncbi:MAG: 2-isopropylmalate synthase, partial [archaeon GB-1867-005]|nr:2-isopropylmalate synthase [Candidatus Culexmicrobium cathedralense]
HPSEKQLEEIMKRIKDLGDKGKKITDADLLAIARSIMSMPEKKIIDLTDFAVVTGSGITSMASIKLNLDGREYVAAETGVGPVDAAIKAVQKITSELINVRLVEYRLEALTGGSDAVAEVIVKVQDKEGNIISARGAGEDIVRASVEALINGINKLLLVKKS